MLKKNPLDTKLDLPIFLINSDLTFIIVPFLNNLVVFSNKIIHTKTITSQKQFSQYYLRSRKQATSVFFQSDHF